jgi:hypothetical protein
MRKVSSGEGVLSIGNVPSHLDATTNGLNRALGQALWLT